MLCGVHIGIKTRVYFCACEEIFVCCVGDVVVYLALYVARVAQGREGKCRAEGEYVVISRWLVDFSYVRVVRMRGQVVGGQPWCCDVVVSGGALCVDMRLTAPPDGPQGNAYFSHRTVFQV